MMLALTHAATNLHCCIIFVCKLHAFRLNFVNKVVINSIIMTAASQDLAGASPDASDVAQTHWEISQQKGGEQITTAVHGIEAVIQKKCKKDINPKSQFCMQAKPWRTTKDMKVCSVCNKGIHKYLSRMW